MVRYYHVDVVVHTDILLQTAHIIWMKANKPVHEISNNVVCATSKASDQPAHMRSLIRAFTSC